MTAHRKARPRPFSRRFSPGAHRLPPSAASAAVLAAAGVLMCHGALAQGRIPANALPTGPSGQALANGSGSLRQPQVVSGSFNPYSVSGNTATITQNGVAGILRWERFDIGANAKVIISQPSASAVLLNKVDSGAYLDKTVIEGMLQGNGQVYIYNPNGIIFGRTSQVDVNSLVATTLKIDDNRFLAGLLAPSTAPIFKAADGVTPGEVAVEGDAGSQAQLTAARGGKILLVGSTVTNAGRLSAPDGQVMLAAASDKVYLAAPTDVTMRGLLVEVGTGGTAINEKLGRILVEEGNATMVALAVNQSGLVSATTSVQANGSIYLHARGNVAEKNTVSDPLVAQQGGTLTLGEGSVTQVLPDTADKTTAVKSAYHASVVDLSGQSVRFKAGAQVIAPGGDVKVTAQADPKDRSTAGIKSGTTVGSRGVYMEAGSGIDVSGTTDTELAMESNVITVELRGTELADVPLLRNSVLRGQTVKVDRRKGTSLANIQGWLDLIEYGIGENTAAGGTVTFNADQEVVLAEGSRIDVSGGKVNYRAGHVATTQLESARGSVDIGSATADRVYSGLYDAEPGARNYEAAYSDGYSAGSVRFNSASLVLRGELLGSATPGARQRDVSASNYPQGGQLIIGSGSRLDTDDLANNSKISFLGRIAFGGTSTANAATPLYGTLWSASDADMMALRATADIDATQLASNGFTRINAYTHSDLANSGGLGNIAGTVTVDGGVSLGAGGEFRVAAEETVDLNADIRIAGGTVEAKAATSRLSVADGVSIDVAGVWTNDRSSSAPRDAQGNLSAAVVTGGGSIVLSGVGNTSLNGGIGLAVGDGASFDASGGAWQNAKGKLSGGSGGTIALTASPSGVTPESAGLTMGEDVDFRAYGLAKGGTLKLAGRNVELGGAGTGEAGDLNLSEAFFTRGGFAKYDITAAGNLTVAGTIAPRMDNWVAGRSTLSAEGGSMADAFDIETLPLAGVRGSRNATSISLTAAAKVKDGYGRLWLKEGAAIETDPGATVTLTAGRQLTVDGRITDHGGTVNLSLSAQTGDSDMVYRPERSIWLGKTAVIDVSGTAARLWTDDQGYTQGELLDGGGIRIGRLSGTSLAAALGYVAIEEGARLDVSGTTADMTLLPGKRTALQTREVASAGGSIDIRSREGLLIEGELSGAGGNASASGGSLSLTLDRGGARHAADSSATALDLVVLSRKFSTGSGDQYIVPKALDADEAFGSETEGKGYVLASTLSDGGFDSIALKSQDTVGFDASAGAVAVSARAEITVDAPVIAVRNATQTDKTVTLAARHVALGNSDWRYQGSGATASAGDGATLDVKATTIDIVGKSVLQGFTTANFRAGEDIRYVGVVAKDLTVDPPTTLPAIHALGSLAMVGNMNFIAAQVYPTTLSEFALTATGSGSTIAFYRNGVDADSPLSAAGTLSVEADHIVQNGVLRAPFGSLTLTAADTLSFGAGSLTSVAGEGSVPLGRVDNGRAWVYDFGNGHVVTLNDTSASNSVTLPDKEIIATAPTIEVDASATLDLSGGGDLYAYEFTAGPGGSRDVLAKAAGSTTATTFAILPGYDSSAAPLDYQYQQDGGLKVGDRIYLSGIPGLAAGYYTLLPAHYALLKGGFAVTAVSGTRDLSASGTYQKIDGQWVVAGYRASSVAQDGRWSGFLVTSNAQVRDRSTFTDYSANTMLAGTTTRAPRDGGHVAFAATSALTLDGLVKLGAVSAGRGGLADISAPEIAIVADKSQSGSGVKLSVAQLMALGADSLLLGGVRELQSDGTSVTVGADKVTLANDAAHPLTGPEIILAARDEVRLTGSSRIASEGTPAAAAGDLTVVGSGADADGALLRVSGGKQVAVVRDAPAGDRGTLTIESGARVGAAGSMNLDATHAFDNRGTLALEEGAALGLGANRISFGDEVPVSVDGLRFDTAALAALSELADLSLTSYTTFDVHGSAELGSASTGTLALRGAGIQSYGDAGDTLTLKADTVRFDGGGTYTLATPAPAAAATLAVTATDVEIGSKAFALKGFAATTVTAQREVRAVGTAGSLTAEKAMTVNAGLFTAESGTSATIAAGGKLTLGGVANAQAPVTTRALGGKLRFEGDRIESAADITARSGQVALAAANGVQVTGGVIDVSGYSRTFGSTTAYAGAGSIELDGGSGNVEVGADATLDLSAVGADAGLLTVKATNGSNGQATLAGTLKAGATAGIDGEAQTQGRFVFDADQVNGFGALNEKLNAAGFTEARSFRIRHDDVTLAEGESIVAHDVLIAADNGNVTVAGSIDADGDKGGSIQIYASQAGNAGGLGNVTLTGTARLSAKATQAADSEAGSAGDGGRVIIGTATADGSMVAATAGNSSIDLQEGAVIDVSGLGAGQGGTVTLRAPRVGSDAGSDVAVAGVQATITGSRDTVIEGFKTYTASQITEAADEGDNLSAGTGGAMYTDAAAFAGHSADILDRLASDDSSLKLRAGVEVRSLGDLLVSVNETATNPQDRGWNLNAWRFDGEPGVLTLRAAGDLVVAGSISDGFVKSGNKTSMPGWDLDTTGSDSWSYRLAGGADLDAAHPLAVKASNAAGDVKVMFVRTDSVLKDQPVAMIRTGTGSIDIAAARDVVLDSVLVDIANPYASVDGNSTVETTLGATIYTAGRYTALEEGFLAPKRQTINSSYTKETVANKTVASPGFAREGGSISIVAGRDVIGTATNQSVNTWLFRRGKVTTDADGNLVYGAANSTDGNTPATRYEDILSTGWWIRYDYFSQGIATLGGGDLTVSAGGNIENLSLSAATSGQLPGTAPGQSPLAERGGGDLRVRAGGDIRGGSFYVQKGNASLTAGGSVVAGDNVVAVDGLGDVALRSVLALGDGTIDVTATGNVEIETVYNPTLTRQSTYNADNNTDLKRTSPLSAFGTYDADAEDGDAVSGVTLTSLAGDVVIDGNVAALSTAAQPWTNASDSTLIVYPPSFRAVAMTGNIRFLNGFSLWSAATGQLDLLAAGSIRAEYPRLENGNILGGAQPIAMLDASPDALPNLYAPVSGYEAMNEIANILNPASDLDGLAYHTSGGLHAGDDQPVRLIALGGDIVGETYYGSQTSAFYTLILPKAAEIIAGGDIVDLGFKIQHLDADDVTTVTAGGDFIDTSYSGLSDVRHIVTGPGRLDITAAGDIDLGTSGGIVTRGNLDNPYLPEEGAAINLLAGARADYVAFADAYLNKDNLPAAERSALVAYLRELDSSLSADMNATAALAVFKALPAAQQAPFLAARKPLLNDIFFEQIRIASGSKGGGALDLVAFDAVIESLFPAAGITGGDINVFGSQLKTTSGGSINLFAPGGSVQAGLAEKPAWVKARGSSFDSELGVYTIAGGNLQALVKKDFLVNQGRVFTLGGGDITLVSQYGDIDAGKGAKTAQSTPPPVMRTDEKGNTIVDISASISGSGIATLRTGPEVPASSVYPIAPRGIFDAGDAGVRSTGTVSIVAQTVLNANNIAAAGGISGAQAVDSSGLGGAVAAPTVASTATDAFAAPAAGDANAGSLTVELVGYGGADGQEPVTKAGQTSALADEDADDQRKRKKLQKPAADSK